MKSSTILCFFLLFFALYFFSDDTSFLGQNLRSSSVPDDESQPQGGVSSPFLHRKFKCHKSKVVSNFMSFCDKNMSPIYRKFHFCFIWCSKLLILCFACQRKQQRKARFQSCFIIQIRISRANIFLSVVSRVETSYCVVRDVLNRNATWNVGHCWRSKGIESRHREYFKAQILEQRWHRRFRWFGISFRLPRSHYSSISYPKATETVMQSYSDWDGRHNWSEVELLLERKTFISICR